MIRTVSLLFVALLVLAQSVEAAELQEASFANGVKLIVEEDHSAPVAMIEIWLKVGGRDEVPGKTGLAHVFEHMMFKGSKALGPGEYSRRIAAIGGNDNAFTSTDYTAYFETVPAARVAEVLGMEAERFANLKLDPREFAQEIKVIMEERRMRTDDDPNSRMFEELAAVSLRLSPYRNPVIGWMQDLQHLSNDDVQSFYDKHYVPGNVTVVVVGDVDFAEMKQAVAKGFGKIRKREVSVRFNPVEPEPTGPKRVTVALPAELPVLAVALPVPVWQPGKNDREVAALALATEMLTGGRAAFLQRELVDMKGLAVAAGAGYDPFGMGVDLWYAYANFGPKHQPEAFEKAFWKLIADMGRRQMPAKALAAAKKREIASEVFAQDSLYLRAMQIGRLETVGIGADHRDEWLDAIRKVSAADVQQVVKKYLRPERATTGLLQPKALIGKGGRS